jgi:hypothetical protein
MARTQRDRIAMVLVCLALGLFAAAFLSYIYHWGTDWENYSYWARRWIFTTGLVLVGIIARIVLMRGKESTRKHSDHDATRKT